MFSNFSWEIDGWIILAGSLCAASAALLGNFLVLRRQSLLGDAISHAVLPGLAAAFLLTGERQGWVMFLGAASVGVLTVLLIEFARQFGRVDESASIGVVFTSLFALGLVMIVKAADRVDLDPGCVLYGSIETSMINRVSVFGWSVPRVVATLGTVVAINSLFVFGLYRMLKVSTFDPQLARAQGIPVTCIHYSLAGLVAITSVAAFESVGNILVVAMFVVPPVTAWLLTDRLGVMIGLSVVAGVLAAALGHVAAIVVPGWFGFHSTSTAGMMAVASGGLLVLAIFLAPRKGLVPRAVRDWQVTRRIVSEDVLAMLYRAELRGSAAITKRALSQTLMVSRFLSEAVIARLLRRGQLRELDGQVTLTDSGRSLAQNVVRSHRLWEHYLSTEAGIADRLLHEGAERLEHFTDRELRQRLSVESNAPRVDPHGKLIPPEAE